MRATRIATAVGIVLLTTLISALLLSAPSQAEPKKLKVATSASGPWLDHLSSPLFDGDGPLVPTDRVRDRFYLKNGSHQPARATLAVVDRSAGNDFERQLTFTTNIGGVTTDVPVLAASRTGCKAYVTGPTIPAGGVQPVDVTLAFGEVAGQAAMDQDAAVDFIVTLSQVGPNGKVDVCGAQAAAEPFAECADTAGTVVTIVGTSTCTRAAGAEGGSPLAETGAPRNSRTLAALGVVLLASGGALLAVRRSRETD